MATLRGAFEARGRRARTVGAERTEELLEDLFRGLERRPLDPHLQKRTMEPFRERAGVFPQARSLVVVASPEPPTPVRFRHRGRRIETLLPPQYAHQKDLEETARILREHLPPGERFEAVRLPLKLLAARSGLGRYGRNRVLFVPDMGSCCHLAAFALSLPPEEETWGPAEPLPRCSSCGLCVARCPSGALGKGWHDFDSSRCLTRHNEETDPLPGWMDPGWHHSLLGCTRCQELCPANRGIWDHPLSPVDFDEEETETILRASGFEALPGPVRERLADLGLAEDFAPAARNLRLLLG